MPTFRTRGGTGQAPTTVYFGYVPDKFSMLQIGYNDNSNAIHLVASPSAKNVNQWVIYNQNQLGGSNVPTSSFGALTTAPDGTNTAQKMVESATNTIHGAVTCLIAPLSSGFGWLMRVSVFAKAAERTRFALYIGDGLFDPAIHLGSGCKTVFDLAGGQIAVANTAYTGGNPAYTPGPTEIASFGNGWYRCTMDVVMGGGGQNGYGFGILLDNGSGTAAESTSYNGNGTSGVYFWRSTGLPPAAWSIQTQTFVDDFTTLNTFDLTNTNDPTKTWWLGPSSPGIWPGFGAFVAIPSSALSIVGGTILKIASPGNNTTFMTAAYTGVGPGYISSFTYKPPALIECSMSWDGGTDPVGSGPTYWSTDIPRLLHDQSVFNNPPSGEMDWMEWTPGGVPNSFPGTSSFYGPVGSSGGPAGSAASGIPKWYSTFTYPNGNWFVAFNGVIYQCQRSTINEQPDISPTAWTAVTASSLGIPTDFVTIDWTQQNVFSTIWLAYAGKSNFGQIIKFFNGNFCYGSPPQFPKSGFGFYTPITVGAPGNPPNPQSLPLNLGDGQAWPYLFGPMANGNTFIDYVKVSQ